MFLTFGCSQSIQNLMSSAEITSYKRVYQYRSRQTCQKPTTGPRGRTAYLLMTSESAVTRQHRLISGLPAKRTRTVRREPQKSLLLAGGPVWSAVIQHPLKHRIPPGPVVVPGRNDLLIRPDDIFAGLDELIELHRVADCPV